MKYKTYWPGTSIQVTKDLMRAYREECRKHPKELAPVELLSDVNKFQFLELKSRRQGLLKAWRSSKHAVYLYRESEKESLRLTFQSTDFNPVTGQWRGELTWDDLMRLKKEAGYGDRWAVECFPPDDAVVNVANLRHLWLLDEPPAYAWT